MYGGDGKNLAALRPVVEPQKNGGRRWLDEYDTPSWLVGGGTLYDNEWRIDDDTDTRCHSRLNWEFPLYDPITKKVSILTDPENEALLEVAQRICIALREGNVRKIESASSQVQLTRRIILILAWMRLNFIYRLDQLKPSHFRLFMKAAPWGVVRLLDAETRFNDYLDSLKVSGQKFPVTTDEKNKRSQKSYFKIDVFGTYRLLGIDPEFNNQMGANFIYQFWNSVAAINGPEWVPKRHKHYIEMEEEPERVTSTRDNLSKYVAAWQTLHDMAYLLPQECSVDPEHDFVAGVRMTSRKIASEILAVAGIESDEGITETIPDRQAFHIINQACRWIINYADDLLELRKRGFKTISGLQLTGGARASRLSTLLRNFTPKSFTENDSGAPWPLIASARAKDITDRSLTIDEATCGFLMAACVIVIAAFTARRRLEVMTIKGGEPTGNDKVPRALWFDQHGNPWIWSFIEKTFQKWDRTPIPPVVVKALEVLEELTESTRKKNGNRKLFEAQVLNRQSLFKFNIVEGINLFAKFVQVPLLDNGSTWVFKPHQFRRFFSLVYMYRFNYGEHGKMEVLSHQLRHFNMEMTKRYIEEIYESDMLKAHSKNIVVDFMSEVLRGERNAFAPGGEAMKQHLEEMLQDVIKDSEILSGRENTLVARKIAERVMEKLNVEMVPFKWGYCYAYKDNQNGKFCGNCIADDEKADKPNIARATPKVCLGCEHLYVDENFRVPWELGAKTYRSSLEKGYRTDIMTQYAEGYAAVYEEGLMQYFGVGPEGKA